MDDDPTGIATTDQAGTPAPKIYRHLPDVATQIGSLQATSARDIIERAGVNNPDDPSYLKEEAIIYLMRQALLNGESTLCNDLMSLLMARADRALRKWFGSEQGDQFADAVSDWALKIFEAITAPLPSLAGLYALNQCDMLECRFWVVAHSRALDIGRKRSSGIWQHVVENRSQDEEMPDRLSALPDVGQLAPEQQYLIKEALSSMAEPMRTVWLAVRFYGLSIESQDPSVMTASRFFKVSGRTIRNYLTKAEDALAVWRGDSTQ